MRGVPARQTGWMSRHGHPLKPDVEGRLICPESGFEYAEDTDEGGKVLSCRSLDEESQLPEALQLDA